jgi:hypothetical protein
MMNDIGEIIAVIVIKAVVIVQDKQYIKSPFVITWGFLHFRNCPF